MRAFQRCLIKSQKRIKQILNLNIQRKLLIFLKRMLKRANNLKRLRRIKKLIASPFQILSTESNEKVCPI